MTLPIRTIRIATQGPAGPKGDPGDPATAPVTSVAGRTGVVTLSKGDVGLSAVPNIDASARENHTGTQAASTVSGLSAVATSGSAADLSGALADARLSANVPLLNATNTFTAKQTLTPPANTSAVAVSGYSLTGANTQPLLDLAGTWNTSGAPSALKLSITDTASAAGSLLVDLQVGGTTKLAVKKNGDLTFAPGSNLPQTISAGTGYFQLGAQGASDVLNIGSGSINPGGSVSAFKAGTASMSFTALHLATTVSAGGSNATLLKPKANGVSARKADDSAYHLLQGKLQTDANAATETITPDRTLTLYDAAGVAYKVPCVAA